MPSPRSLFVHRVDQKSDSTKLVAGLRAAALVRNEPKALMALLEKTLAPPKRAAYNPYKRCVRGATL